MESIRVLDLGHEAWVLNDIGNTHSFTREYNPFHASFDDILCLIIKSINCSRKNIWVLCQTRNSFNLLEFGFAFAKSIFCLKLF